MASTSNNFEKQLEAYIAHMNEELHAAQSLIEAMEAAERDKSKYSSGASEYLQLIIEFLEHDGMKDPSKLPAAKLAAMVRKLYPRLYKEYEACEVHIQKDDEVIKKREAALAKIDPNLSGMITNLNELIQKSEDLLKDGIRSSDFKKAIGQINKIFMNLCQAILSKIQIDFAEKGMKQFGSDPSHAAAIMELAGIAIRGDFSEQNSLQSIQNEVISDITSWQAEKSAAEADLKTYHWYNCFGGGPDTAKDHAEIRAANAMISLLSSVEQLISPLITQIDPGMQEFSIELDQLKKKFNEFLQGHGTLQGLKDAMIAALSIMVGIIAETSKDASAYDKEMSQGTTATMQMHLADSLDQEKVILDAKKYASIMSKLMTAAKYIGMALLLLLSPSAAMAFMMLLDATLNATGVMDKMQNALAKKCGSTGAAVITGLTEAAGTAGGAAAIEAIVSKVVIETAVQASAEAAEKATQSAIQTATTAAVKAAGGVGKDEAEQVVTQAVTEAVEMAREKVADTVLSKSLPQMLSALTKGGLKEAMLSAQKVAAEDAAQEIQILAETAAKQGSTQVVGEETIKAIAEKSANKATAEAMQISEKSAAKLGTKSALSKFGTRAAFVGMGAAATTDLSTDLFAAIQGKKKKDLSEEWQIAMQVINTIMELVAMLGATGQGAEVLQNPGLMSKVLLGLNTASGVARTGASLGEAEAAFAQAHAVKAVAKDQAGLDLMQFVLEQLQQEGSAQRDAYAKEMSQVGKTNLKLSMHFNDAQEAVAQALSVSAV